MTGGNTKEGDSESNAEVTSQGVSRCLDLMVANPSSPRRIAYEAGVKIIDEHENKTSPRTRMHLRKLSSMSCAQHVSYASFAMLAVLR